MSSNNYYFPSRWVWERKNPSVLGVNASKLEDAIKFAKENETELIIDLLRDKKDELKSDPHDDGTVVGPLKDRGPVTGLIIKNGYIIAEWGNPERVDVAYSATKSFIATAFGLAYDRGLIHNLDDLVKK